jgi:hypothetical protein
MYNELLAKDKKGVGEIAENNIKINKLMESITPIGKCSSARNAIARNRFFKPFSK